MSLLHHAKRELDIIGMTESTDSMDKSMRDHILHMIEEFSKEGHSGFSASYAISCLQKLLRFEPLSPLTGEDSEWCNVSEASGYTLYQNNRCSRIFKDDKGCYDIDGKVFVEYFIDDNGERSSCTFTNIDSRVPVVFPYVPKTEYVDVGNFSAVMDQGV
jgi:hypothetical protein